MSNISKVIVMINEPTQTVSKGIMATCENDSWFITILIDDFLYRERIENRIATKLSFDEVIVKISLYICGLFNFENGDSIVFQEHKCRTMFYTRHVSQLIDFNYLLRDMVRRTRI